MNKLFESLRILTTDYDEYGGEVKRWEKNELDYPDCSCGCRHFVRLSEDLGADWGVCSNPKSPRKGLLTWEHQAGFNCFEKEQEKDQCHT